MTNVAGQPESRICSGMTLRPDRWSTPPRSWPWWEQRPRRWLTQRPRPPL